MVTINSRLNISWLGAVVVLFAPLSYCADIAADDFFETQVRPVLVEKCGSCHGSDEQSGGLRIDSRDSLTTGGSSGPAVVPGSPAESLLIQAVRRQGELAMPPDETLSDQAIAALEQWIADGASWPASLGPLTTPSSETAKSHWAFQPVKRPAVPQFESLAASDSAEPVRTPIDAFVRAQLIDKQLSPSSAADRRTLIRRVTYSLTGLPPSPTDVEQFIADPDPQAYEQLVERLLNSQQYGEQWARHWLDVARYSDTKGYVYAREERFWPHAWAYRDWVVQALNDDMPYDRFLLLQLAADQVDDRQQSDLAAMGFLTLGRRFLGVQRDIIDDRIDVVSRGTMGLTVACARCHDHKYDPIPTADYYSLYGVFGSCAERLEALQDPPGDEAFASELRKRQTELAETLKARREESSERVRNRLADYLFAQSELHKYPADGFDQIFETDDLLPAFVRRWERYLRQARQQDDPVFSAWHRFVDLPDESFAQQAVAVSQQLASASADQVHPLVARAFEQPPQSLREVCDRYGELFAEVKSQAATSVPDADSESLRAVLYGPDAPCQVPAGPISLLETYFDSGTCTALWKLQGEVDRWIIQSPNPAPFALTLVDQSSPVEPRIFRRGNPLNQGDDVPRQFLSVLAGEDRQPFQQGSGRLELAQAIIDPSNPLTARVIVNRLWTHHFGQGLVSTPSDFGTRATPPSHPELLDWLASELIAEGWSLKHVHRNIVLSATYRQSSSGPAVSDALARAAQIDPDNRLLWRTNSRRLTFEEFRDSLLAATGELDRTLGGKPAPLFEPPYPQRRTLYGLVDRQYLPGTLRMFDFANPDLHVPQRSETTVPQQALFFMNHPLVLERARSLAELSAASDQAPVARVANLFQQVFQRAPTDTEVADALALIQAAAPTDNPASRASAANWQYGYGAVDEAAKSVSTFTPLPHFNGQAWQGGANWPDAQLGWVQLTAQGGHPGNDRNHAAIRRWTAPREMTIRIRSELNHVPSEGDGIRAWIVSSRGGIQHGVQIHHETQQLDVESLQVSPGDTVDFVVDIGDVLNSDQFLWKATIEDLLSSNEPASWDSAADFPQNSVDRLDPWEQLAQVLLCSNEFLFVD